MAAVSIDIPKPNTTPLTTSLPIAYEMQDTPIPKIASEILMISFFFCVIKRTPF